MQHDTMTSAMPPANASLPHDQPQTMSNTMDSGSDSESTELADAVKRVPGALYVVPEDASENDYAWLDLADEDNCFMPLALSDSRPSKSLDFGSNGFTGSLSTWHELLQMTAPDAQCGVVFVRGDFPDNPDSILARAQRRNQKGTFGMTIRIPPDQSWAQEPTAAQGLINLRWPYTRLNWVRNSDLGGDPFASFTVCSFVDHGTLYQIARIVPKTLARPSPRASSVDLARKTNIETPVTYTIDVGGLIRFGCPKTMGNGSHLASPIDAPRVFPDNYTIEPADPETPAEAFTCTSEHHQKRLEIRLWVNRELQSLPRHKCEVARLHHGPNEVASLHIRKELAFDDKKATVMVSSFRLVDSIDPKPEHMDSISYEKVMLHLGVADDSIRAPYRLWSALIGSSSGADSFELNAAARAVETVLGVAALPVPVPEHDANRQQKPSRIALLKNIINPQVVDLESAFWQTRLLVSAAKRLNDPFQWPYRTSITQYRKDQYDAMKACYRRKIVHYIRGLCCWLLDLYSLTGPFSRASVGILASDILLGVKSQETRHLCGPDMPISLIGDQKYYGATTVWYVMRQLPEIFDDNPTQDELWDKVCSFATVQTSYDSKSARSPVATDDPYGCIIRWYHNYSLLHICQELQKRDADRFETLPESIRLLCTSSNPQETPTQRTIIPHGDVSSPGAVSQETSKAPLSTGPMPIRSETSQNLEERIDEWQSKVEKAMRLYEQGRLRGRELGHETANLANISIELGIPITAITIRGLPCLDLAKNLISRREHTKKLNAGRSHILRWDPQHNIRSAKPRPAPWELSCLAQHLPYAIGLEGCNKDKCLERVRNFMFTDYSFMGSWDPSKTTTVGQWWDYTTTSIVCAKLLEDAQITSRTPPEEEGDDISRMVHKGLQLLQEIHAAQKSPGNHTDTPFQWIKMKPKKIYHSDSAVLSVEDTPEIHKMYQRPGTDVLATRLNLHRYFESNYLPKSGYTLQTIDQNIGASKLHNMSCLDIVLATGRNDQPETSRPVVRGRADTGFWNDWREQDHHRQQLFDLFSEKGAGGLKDLYLIGKPKAHPFYKRHRDLLKDSHIKRDLLVDYQTRLFLALNDSLVDQNVKYRVIFAKRFSPITLQAMVYMWHPEAIDTFDDHFGELSNFRNTIDQSVSGSDNTWISSITIKHWRLLGDDESMVRKAEKEVDEAERISRYEKQEATRGAKICRCPLWYHKKSRPPRASTADHGDAGTNTRPIEEHDKDCDFPPPGVRDERQGSPVLLWNMHELNKIHELSVSMAITGDPMGRGWTCSIVCELFKEDEVIKYTEEASHILQMFIHQQDSARALVFLMFLGYICLALAKECDRFMDELNGVMKLDSQVLLNGLEWEKSDRALKKLKQMLWGYESLRGFGDMLDKALQEVRKAHSKMAKFLGEGSGVRHDDMKRAALQIQEEFEKKFNLLEAAHHAVQQRVEQGFKLREGIASVLGVEQNENISMLTWLTIIYLGPTLVVGLFGMSNNPILNDASSATFYRLLGGLLGGTLLFALCLSTIIAVVRFLWRIITHPAKHAWDKSRQHFRDKATYLWKYRQQLVWFPVWARFLFRRQGRKAQSDIEKPFKRGASAQA